MASRLSPKQYTVGWKCCKNCPLPWVIWPLNLTIFLWPGKQHSVTLNPRFSPGLFALEIVTIKAYGGKNRLIIVKEGEIAEKSLLDASGYPYEAIDSAQIFAKLN